MFGWKSEGRKAATRTSEFSGAYDGGAVGVMSGIVAGTRVATAIGWRPVEAVSVGDKVLTFDGGLQRVTGVRRQVLWSGEGDCPRRFWPLSVPAGALGNREVMSLLPRQPVMVESDSAEELFGDPFALIPAMSLDDINGITRAPPRGPVEVITVQFADDQVVFANSGALFLCPAACDLVSDALEGRAASPYLPLPLDEARSLTLMIEQEASGVCGFHTHAAEMAAAA